MSVSKTEHFILHGDGPVSDLEFYLNSHGEIFVNEHNVTGGYFFTINPPDWEELKIFIDKQFKKDE